jgi:amino acid adenylation domain-containing protein
MAPATFVDILRTRAASRPDRLAYRFLADGDADEQTLTYAQLHVRASIVADRLRAHYAQGSPVLLVYPPGLDFICGFLGCLMAGAFAVPVPVAGSGPKLARLEAVAADVGAALVLTTTELEPKLARWGADSPRFASIRRVAIDPGDADSPTPAASANGVDVTPDAPAFLQYSSGSTGTPRGIIVSHRNLIENSALMARSFRYGSDSQCFTWLPPYHDMGLIGGILQPLHGGFPCTLISPAHFLQAPLRWLHGITRYRATVSGGPSFAYELCAARVRPEQMAGLDLRSWSTAFNGAEPVRADTLDRFAAAFAGCGFDRRAFMPCYGLAEATLFVTGGAAGQGAIVREFDRTALLRNTLAPAREDAAPRDVRRLVGVGAPGDDVIIVDPDSRRVTDGVGEIWIDSARCAQGYWHRPAESAETFAASLADAPGRYLRTGDLGAVADGELFVAGRLKDVIVVRGLKYHPQDIERTAERADPALRAGCNAAFGIEAGNGEKLVVVQEIEGASDGLDLPAVIAAIRSRVTAEHDLPPYAVLLAPPGTVLKTSSGKVRRHACRERYQAGTLAIEAEWRDTAAASPPVRASRGADADWIGLLAAHLGVSRGDLQAHARVSALGLDSLRSTELTHFIEATTGVTVPIERLFENPTLGELMAEIAARRRQSPSVPLEDDGVQPAEYPLSHGQRSLLALRALSRGNGGPDINIATAFRVTGPFDTGAFEDAWNQIVARHAMLRSVFVDEPPGPVQRVREHVALVIERIDAAGLDEPARQDAAVAIAYRPFDLRQECPLRVAVLRHPDETLIVIAVSHVAADFWSLSLLFGELQATYRARIAGVPIAGVPIALPPARGRFSAYVRAERQAIEGAEGERLARYWRDRLDPPVTPLQLCADRPRPAIRTFWGDSHPIAIGADATARLRALARQHDTTVYAVCLAVFQVLLARYGGQDDVAVIAPAAVRSRAWADVVGYLVNPLVVRADLSGNPTFREILEAARQRVREGVAHQAYPFPLLLEQVQGEPDLSRAPLAQAMFVLYRTPRDGAVDVAPIAVPSAAAPMSLGDAVLQAIPLRRCMTQYDLSLVMGDGEQGLAGQIEYNTSLFDRPTIDAMARALARAIDAVTAAPGLRLGEIPLLDDAQRSRIVVEWNDTRVDFGRSHVLVDLLSEQAARTPEAPAVIFGDTQVTYRELHDRAGRLARRLRSAGIGPDALVGVLMERSLDMIVALLAVLRAGGAYVPLDPETPRERLRALARGARLPIVLTQRTLAIAPLDEVPRWWPLDQDDPIEEEADQEVTQAAAVLPGNLAYVIFTSGSTGEPKGVMCTHEGICNRLLWMQSVYALGPDDRVLQKTPFTFDVSVWELFWPLLTGATLVMAPPGAHRDPHAIARLIESARVTTIHFVPSMLESFLRDAPPAACASLRRVICSGEALSFELQQAYASRLSAGLYNLYGPTEVSVDATWWTCDPGDTSGRVPIGRPIANTQAHVLDAAHHPAPPGLAGEIHLGGIGVARGYLRQPRMTAARFVPDPFSTVPGSRMFATGDRARWLPNGAIEHLGRDDDQVKVRGARVELGEVEAALARHPGVREVAVAARPHRDELRLVAYAVRRDESQPTASDLRRWAKSRLPDYMVPARIVFLDRLPVSAHGKLDRRALAEPDDERSTVETAFVAPRTPLEAQVAAIWIEVLSIAEVGVEDSFFDLGGHSLSLMQVAARIRESFDVDLPLQVYVDTPTVAGLAAAIAAYPSDETAATAAESSGVLAEGH